jgi:DNA helicase-2/ATP-dependent DNA helicase PcrA
MSNFTLAYNNLNLEQKKAVDTLEGPVMVVAGPGTGKTQMLAIRIANILKKTDVRPENILCLTFTDAGVIAMRERLFSFINKLAYRISVHTFHSFCNEIVQKHPDYFDLPNATQLDEINRIKIVEDILEEIKNNNPDSKIYKSAKNNIRQIISDIQTLKKEGLGPESFKIKVKSLITNFKNSETFAKQTQKAKKHLEKLEKSLEFAVLYSKYQQALYNKGLYDYEDMINFVISAFKENDELLAQYQEQYLYIHVDEYQDTNGSQNELIHLLGSYDQSPNIFVVGDDDQAIFKFQGANVENIFKFSTFFKDVKIIPTIQNYRSSQLILDAADSLIKNNTSRLTNKIDNLSKKLKANRKLKNKPIDILEFKDSTSENIFIAREIIRLNHEENIPFSKIAVIYRNHNHANELIRILQKLEIPIKLKNTINIWDDPNINKLIKILRAIFLFDEKEDLFLYEILEYDIFEIEPVFLYKLANFIKQKRIKFLDFFTNIEYIEEFSNQLDKEYIDDFKKSKDIIQKLFIYSKEKFNLNIVYLIEKIIYELGFLDFFQKHNDIDSLRIFSNLINFLSHNMVINKNFDLATFLRDLEIIEKTNIQMPLFEFDDQKDAVTLTTAHSSKGLQYNRVFILRATQSAWVNNIPTRSYIPKEVITEFEENSTDPKDMKIEDDRRLFYVAMTRSEQHIYITYSLKYIDSYSNETNTRLMFIDEIDEKYLNKKSDIQLEYNQKEYFKIIKPQQINFTDRQNEYIKSKIKNLKISYSIINSYINDPIKFLREKILGYPSLTNKHIAVGSAVHKTIEKVNLMLKEGKLMKLDDFIETYKQALYRIYYGFNDYEDALKEGCENLELYYKEEILKAGPEKIAGVEYDFGNHNVVLPIPNAEPVLLSGRIDLITILDADTNEVKIVDYKYKESISENQILGKTKAKDESILRQLTFYKLAAELDHYFRPQKILSKAKYNVVTTEIRFLKPKKYNKSNKFGSKQIEIHNTYVDNLKSLIYEIVSKIRNLEFEEEYRPISLISGERI